MRTPRYRVGLAAILALSLGLTACGGGEEGSVSEGPIEDGDAESADPEGGGDDSAASGELGEGVVVGVTADPPTLNPAMTTDYTTGVVSGSVFSGLVRVTSEFTAEPSLATDWEISDDGLTYSFELRDDVQWHDGEPFTADDVVYSFNEALAEYHPRASGLVSDLGLEATATGEHSVDLTIEEPYAPLMKQLAVTEAPILPEHIYAGEDFETHEANEAPIGTGPFTFVEWSSGSHIRLDANPDYWGDGPHVESITVSIVPEASNLSIGLETGEIDFVPPYYVERGDITRLADMESLEIVERTGIPALHLLMMNTQNAPLDNVEVRHAIATAIDRGSIVELAMDGQGLVGEDAFGSAYPWARAEEDSNYSALFAHDVESATGAISEAGAEGATLRLVYDSANAGFVSEAELIRDQLAAIGLNVELTPRDRNVMTEQVFADRDFDLTLQSYYSGGDPAIGYHRIYSSYEGEEPFTNPTGFGNADVDDLFAQAAQLADEQERAELYAEALSIVNESMPALVLLDTTGTTFSTADLENIWQLADPRDGWADVRWAD